MYTKRMQLAILLFVCCGSGFAQSSTIGVDVYFRQDVYVIEEDVKENKTKLQDLASILNRITTDSLSYIESIEINSWTSPEPSVAYNKTLSQRRSESIRQHILQNFQKIPDSLIVANGNGIAWDRLRDLVDISDMQYRDEVLSILDNVPEETWRRVKPTDRWQTLVDSRLKRLMDLRGGRPYNYMYDHIFPELRYGSLITIHYREIPLIEQPQHEAFNSLPPEVEITIPNLEPDPTGPVIALKTNLLFDAVTALNVELEVPIGRRWSVAGEWIFPWWVTSDNGNALEILSANIEGRYWFGERDDRPYLTGWFGGIYAGGGLYDLQYQNNGYQGEFYIAAGLGLGYAHLINKSGSLRMEYELGFGYLNTEYRYYEGMQDNKYLVWQYDGRYSWIGPTRARASLVWFIDFKRGGKR